MKRYSRYSALGCLLLFLSTAALKCGGPPVLAPLASSNSGNSAQPDPSGCGGLTVTAGLQVWLDAESLSVGDGGGVSTWSDCHNSALTASQAVAASQPTFSASGGPNNKPYVSFDGTNDYMSVSANQVDLSAGGLTIFMLTQFSPYTGSSWRYLLEKYNGSNSTGFEFILNTNYNFIPMLGGSGSTEGGTYTAGTWNLINFVVDGTTVTEYQNGGATGLSTGSSYATNAMDLYLFAAKTGGGATGFVGGKLAELMIYNGPLSSDDRLTVQCYLNKKYDLKIPYCN